MKRKLLFIAVLAAGTVFGSYAAKPGVIAHRGYWDVPTSAQNSIRSLIKADSIKAFGSEFDVWYTADKKLVVNHDDAINGIVIETAKAADVLAQKLPNGENVPTLEAYLDKAKQLNTKLIFELKPHKDLAHEREAVKEVIKLVNKKGLNNRVEYITFSLSALVAFIQNAPKGTEVYYLNGDLTPRQLMQLGAAGPDYHMNVFRKNPTWIKECHDLGMKVNVWTVNKKADMEYFIGEGVDYITTNDPELLESLISAQN